MTVIAAIVDETGAYMAADTRVCRGTEYLDGVTKIHQRGLSLVGNSGYAHFDSVIDEYWSPPGAVLPAEEVEVRCNVLARALMAHRAATTVAGEEAPWCSVLIATLQGLWRVDSAGSVIPVARGWDATGSGGEAARAVLWFCADSKDAPVFPGMLPGTVLRCAALAAIALDSGCGGEPQLLVLPRGGEGQA